MEVLSVEQIRKADHRCIEELGIPVEVLMESAGRAVFAQIDRGPVGIVCGKGNNGGDGYVVARLALIHELQPHVISIVDPEELTGPARLYCDVYRKLGGKFTVATDEAAIKKAFGQLKDCAVIVDAVLGTGVEGEVHGTPRAAIDNWPDVPTISVDVPSGMNADTGEICGACIRATKTVTMQFAKRGFLKEEAKPYLGELIVADIGIPDVCADDHTWDWLKDRW
ncbi:MAG: NAD(P)H-hydrate epimerase [Candidatus Hydrogenedentales bacterium]